MTEALLVSNILLWVAVVVLSGLVLALLRQVGVLHERVSPAGALLTGGGPQVGEAAPVIEATDWEGGTQTVGGSDPGGRGTLVFFVSPTCPVCKTLLPIVESVARAEDPAIRILLASDGARAEHERFVANGMTRGLPYLLSTELGVTYQVAKLPYALLLDGAGVLRARGLVNTREHLESLFEAANRGVASVQDFLAEEASREPAEEASTAKAHDHSGGDEDARRVA